MISRIRTHILEEESLFELKKILPNEWVKDYGIDVEVEIFSSKGENTGKVFWIQLKATDSKNKKVCKSVRMPIVKIKQLASYDIPVALFRYNSENKIFYFDWIVRSVYLSASSNNKSFNIEFQDHHLWTKHSTDQIISFLKKQIKFKTGSFFFPISGIINPINVPDKTARKLSARISKDVMQINIVRDRYLADIEINILDNRIVLNLAGSFGGSIGYDKADINNEDLIFNAFENCFLIILSKSNKDVEFFKFINDHNLLQQVINHPEMLQYLMPKLIASESGMHFTEVIVDHVFKSGDAITSSIIQTIVFLSNNDIISKLRVESYFNQVINLDLESGNLTSLGTSYYNLGGYYRGIKKGNYI